VISALPTWFKGTLYRSRLEASWAQFFDENGFEFQYEPQGFLCSSKYYLCDFLVKLFRHEWCWVEVKPTMDFDRSKVIDFTASICHLPEDCGYPSSGLFVFVGKPSNHTVISLISGRSGDCPEDGWPTEWPNCSKEVIGTIGPWSFIWCPECCKYRFYQFSPCKCGVSLKALAPPKTLEVKRLFCVEVPA
jgi:hypothetical protein